MRKYSLLMLGVCALTLSGCQSYLNYRYPPGEMASNGRVYPCNDYRINPQACGEARYNAPRVIRLVLGQTRDEALKIMQREPEERSVRLETGRSVETWGYLTDYDRTIVTVITLIDGKIASIEASQR